MYTKILVGALCALVAMGFAGMPTAQAADTEEGVQGTRMGAGLGARDGTGPALYQDGRGRAEGGRGAGLGPRDGAGPGNRRDAGGARDGRGRGDRGRGAGLGPRDGSGPGHRQDAGGPRDGRGNGPRDGRGENPNCQR